MINRTNKDNIDVIYEDNHIIVINKRVGDIVQADTTQDKPLNEILKEYLKEKYNKPGNVYLGVVHRLDRPTSGVVVFAKTSKALARLNESFRNRDTNKIYLAIVKKCEISSQAILEHYLLRNPKNNKSKAFANEVPNSKLAKLHYKIKYILNNYFVLEIKLFTGRHHQIRAQLAAIGAPIKGDLKYGYERSNDDGGIALHAHKLTLTHPVTKEEIIFKANIPNNSTWKMAFNLINTE